MPHAAVFPVVFRQRNSMREKERERERERASTQETRVQQTFNWLAGRALCPASWLIFWFAIHLGKRLESFAYFLPRANKLSVRAVIVNYIDIFLDITMLDYIVFSACFEAKGTRLVRSSYHAIRSMPQKGKCHDKAKGSYLAYLHSLGIAQHPKSIQQILATHKPIGHNSKSSRKREGERNYPT